MTDSVSKGLGMIDILAKLRMRNAPFAVGDLIAEAADEIERLRNKLADLTRRSESCEICDLCERKAIVRAAAKLGKGM